MIGFLQARMIRLYPGIVVGSLIGFLVLIGRNLSTCSVTVAQALLDYGQCAFADSDASVNIAGVAYISR